MKRTRGILPPDDHKDLPFEGGSEPVPHVSEPVPGPGTSLAHWLVIALCALIAVFAVVWLFAF